MPNRKSQAETKADSSTQDEQLQSVRRHNTNTIVMRRFYVDCLTPDWEVGFFREAHSDKSFDKDGFCKVCGMTIEQASCGNIKMPSNGA